MDFQRSRWLRYRLHSHSTLGRSRIVVALFLALGGNTRPSPLPSREDTEALLNHITNFAAFGLAGLRNSNGKLDLVESAAFSIDDGSARIRDALAHGRLVAPTKNFRRHCGNLVEWSLWLRSD